MPAAVSASRNSCSYWKNVSWEVSTLQERWFSCRGPTRRWKRENFQRFWIGGITCWKLEPKVKRIDRIIGSESRNHFETPQIHGNDTETRKLGSVRVEVEKCWTAFLCLWTAASKTELEEVFVHRIVTGDEKCVYYDNLKCRKLWEMPGHASTSTASPNIHGFKVIFFFFNLWLLVQWTNVQNIHAGPEAAQYNKSEFRTAQVRAAQG